MVKVIECVKIQLLKSFDDTYAIIFGPKLLASLNSLNKRDDEKYVKQTTNEDHRTDHLYIAGQ